MSSEIQPKARLYRSQSWLQESLRGVIVAGILVIGIITVGTFGYMAIEGWEPFDSFYMTVITLATVGYREVHPLSENGMIFTVVLIFSGVGVAFYSFSLVARVIVEGELKKLRTFIKMQKTISSLRDHTIICGYGRLAQLVVPELLSKGHPIVVVENSPATIVDLEILGAAFVEGNAYEDETLKAAGIERATNLLAFLPSDADNVFITLSARDLNPNIHIVARSEGASGDNKFHRAGANQVLAPYKVSAAQMVQQLLRPNVSNFLELASGKLGGGLILEEVVVPKGSRLTGKTLGDADLRGKTGVMIAAVIEPDGEMHFNPGRESIISEGATMIVLGKPESVEKLSQVLVMHSSSN